MWYAGIDWADDKHDIMVIDDVGHQEDKRPQQHAAGERQRAALTEQVPVQRREPERRLQRENLDADELGDDGVADQERGQHDKQARRLVRDGHHRSIDGCRGQVSWW